MSKKVLCNFGMICTDHANQTRMFLKKIYFIRPEGLANLGLVHVEFTSIPEAIRQSQQQAQDEGRQSPFFTIDSISAEGLVLSDAGRQDENGTGTNYFFVPMHNIACIHAANKC